MSEGDDQRLAAEARARVLIDQQLDQEVRALVATDPQIAHLLPAR